MKVFFIKPPRYLWPFHSERSGVWQPLGFASMAAVLRREMPDLEVRILDCPALKMGWRTLEATLRADPPDVVCIGEETASAPDGLRLAHLAKGISERIVTVAGGVYFSYMIADSLRNHPIDIIVKGEGEITLLELLQELRRKEPDLGRVRGIAFRKSSGPAAPIVETPPRPLIEDLDDLPVPAYDLLPMQRYGLGARNHPDLAAIEHGRGCRGQCNFCILWKHMGQARDGSPTPCYRTKSPAKVLEEARLLVGKYGRKTLGWVDPTWNIDPAWTDEFCGRMISARLESIATAWMRADCVVRDERLGILKKQVASGLRQAIIGVERPEDAALSSFDKRSNSAEIVREAFAILRRNYPSVYTIATFIYGLWDETEESLRELVRFGCTCGADYAFYIPLTPNPGTAVWEEARRREAIEVDDLRAYNFMTPIMRTRRHSAAQLQQIMHRQIVAAWPRDFGRAVWQFFFDPDPRRRSVRRAMLGHGTRYSIVNILASLRRRDGRPACHGIVPDWYEK